MALIYCAIAILMHNNNIIIIKSCRISFSFWLHVTFLFNKFYRTCTVHTVHGIESIRKIVSFFFLSQIYNIGRSLIGSGAKGYRTLWHSFVIFVYLFFLFDSAQFLGITKILMIYLSISLVIINNSRRLVQISKFPINIFGFRSAHGARWPIINNNKKYFIKWR